MQQRAWERIGMVGVALAALVLGPSPSRAAGGVFVVTSDFQTGSTAYLAPDATAAEADLFTVHGDAGVRYWDGKLYVVNRLGQDNVIVVDAADPRRPELQFSVGNGTNPQDIAVISPQRAYVTRYEVATALIVNPATGDSIGHVDLSGFADADGVPEMGEMAVIGGRLYVALQRLDRSGFPWNPVDDSFLAVVDAASGELVDADPGVAGIQGIRLAAANPNSLIPVGNRLAVSETAAFGDAAGGVELVDPEAGTSAGLAVSEADLGGDITHLTMVSPEKGYAIVSDASYVNSVRSVNLSTGEVGPPLAGLSGGFLQSTAAAGGRLYVGERGSFAAPDAAGLMVYDTATDQLLTGPISTGLPPASIAVLAERRITAVAEDAAAPLPAQARLGLAYPNPFNAAAVIPFDLDQSGPTAVTVRDLLGRPVRTLVRGPLPAGSHALRWDGRDDAGAIVATGTYVVELRAGGVAVARKVTLLK
ncbi:MAG: FlgD immunoglobulin-like domain containing protein [Gemmatimonadota bacterium]